MMRKAHARQPDSYAVSGAAGETLPSTHCPSYPLCPRGAAQLFPEERTHLNKEWC